ncbi:Exportin-5 [Bonamia ostreae]|uniref:Exportin-5 n=1 Tax=Bonamia ostreae TaxID=126728 RepID=A0ABV2AJC2_9EUKA
MDSDTAKNIAMIKEAVLIHHNNPNTEAFKNAHLFLQKFRSDPSCINICLQICSIHESDEIRHFGLQTINMTINSHWKSFSPDQLSTIKEMCTKLITQGSKSVLQEKNYLKEKIVEIVCSVAINGWPNKWPNFFKDLLKISDHSESSLELVLKVLQNLRIETEINFKLPLLRRENIKQSLKSYNGEIYGLVEATFQGCVQNLKNVKTDSNNKMESVALSEALINSALDCLNPNIQFPMEYIFRDEMVDLLCLLCKQPAFFKKSMRCLTLICSKKHIVPQNISSKLYRDKVFLVWQTAIEILEAIISQNHKMDDFEQHLELCVDVIKFLIVNHKKITYRKSQNSF